MPFSFDSRTKPASRKASGILSLNMSRMRFDIAKRPQRLQSIANDLDDRQHGTARIAPGTPHIQYQKTRERMTASGFKVNRFASSIGVTISPSITLMPK